MKAEDINFHNLHLIDKLAIHQKKIKEIEKEYFIQKKIFQNFIEEIDDCHQYDRMSIDEKIINLNHIMTRQNELLEEIEIINEVLDVTKAQLLN